jgi:hypothetical protein
MMTTWKLWRKLKNPVFTHPLFRLTVHNKPLARTSDRHLRAIGILLLGLFFVCALFPGVLGGMGFCSFIGVPFLFVLLNGSFFGLTWSIAISRTVVREQELGTHDLLSVSPVGALGARWLIGTGCLYRNRALPQANGIVRAILIIGFATLMVVALIMLLNIDPARSRSIANTERAQAMSMLIAATALIAALYIDHVQSVVLGSVIGMLAPSYANQRLDAIVWAAGLFLVLQVATYLIFWLAGMILLPVLLDKLQFTGIYAEISTSILRLAFFYFLRERLITLLWHLLVQELNADTLELDFVLRPAAKPVS